MLQTKLVFSCGVLRGVVPHGAPDDGDGELHGGLPHRALAGHGALLLAGAGPHQQPRHTARPRLLQVQQCKTSLAYLDYLGQLISNR